MATITIAGKDYQMAFKGGELALNAGIKLDAEQFSDYKKHNDFVQTLQNHLTNFEPETIAEERDGKWVLTITTEEWFELLSDFQLNAYQHIVSLYKRQLLNPKKLLGEQRAIENLAFVTVQKTVFDKCIAEFDPQWTDRVFKPAITRNPLYLKTLAEYWEARLEQAEGECKKFVLARLQDIPKAYRSSNRKNTDLDE